MDRFNVCLEGILVIFVVLFPLQVEKSSPALWSSDLWKGCRFIRIRLASCFWDGLGQTRTKPSAVEVTACLNSMKSPNAWRELRVLTGLCRHSNKHPQVKSSGWDLLSECKLMRWHENSETAKLNQKNHSGAAGAQEQGCYRQQEEVALPRRTWKYNTTITAKFLLSWSH